MQNRYVGDIGDYVKCAILRALSPGRKLGIAWWLNADEQENNNGRHLSYLERPQEWRNYDPPAFDVLRLVAELSKRDIHLLEQVFPGALFASEQIPSNTKPIADRPAKRRAWLQRIINQFRAADLVFIDPDNGIAPSGFRPTQRESGKSVALAEIDALAENRRSLVIYHHQTRMAGGHSHELAYLAQRIRQETKAQVSGALRARPWSPRAFFLLNADPGLIENAKRVAEKWHPHLAWHPDLRA